MKLSSLSMRSERKTYCGKFANVRNRALLAATVIFLGVYGTPGAATVKGHELVSRGASFALLTVLNDQVFASRQNATVHATPLYNTDWHSNELLINSASRMVEAHGRRIYPVAASDIPIPKKEERSLSDTTFVEMSRAISEKHPERDADIHLIVRPVPLDALGGLYRPGAYFLTWGILGLISESSTEFRSAYLVRVNNSIEAARWGKVECMMGYSLVALDAKSHKIVAKIENQITHSRLPDDFWFEDYASLKDVDKETVKRVCVEGMITSIQSDMLDLGLGAELSNKQ